MLRPLAKQDEIDSIDRELELFGESLEELHPLRFQPTRRVRANPPFSPGGLVGG